MGPLQQMKLVSNNIGYGPRPAPYDEVEQCITLSSDGQVDVVAFRFGEGEPYAKLSSRHRNLDPHEAQTILTLVAAFFEGNPRAFDVTDVGMWELTLTDTGGSEKTYRGPLCGGYEVDGHNLSETLRKTLDIPELIAFDDKGKDSIISRITLDYHRVQKQEEEIICGTGEKHGPWETSERLILDRETGSIEIYRKTSDGAEIRHSFHLCNDEVAYLLGEYGRDVLSEPIGTPDGAEENVLDQRHYVISVEFRSGNTVKQTGCFDKFGVPKDFELFIDEVWEEIEFHEIPDIFRAPLYTKSNRVKEQELIFCSCAFKRGGQTYYYLTEDDSLQEGDFVWVPAGKNNQEKVVRIEEIEVCPEDEPVFSTYDTKRILRRCEKDEIPEEWMTFTPATFFCPLIEREVTPEECEGICLVVQNGFEPSILDKFTPHIEVDLSKEAKCWQCDNPWLNS